MRGRAKNILTSVAAGVLVGALAACSGFTGGTGAGGSGSGSGSGSGNSAGPTTVSLMTWASPQVASFINSRWTS